MLNDGRVKEFDSGHTLMQDKNGLFYKAVHQLPANEIAALKRLAKDKHENKPYIAPPQSPGGDVGAITPQGGGNFLPSFHSNRMSGVLNNLAGNRFSTNRF